MTLNAQQVVLITGAGSGIGKAIALALASAARTLSGSLHCEQGSR
ncbi:hypothetical protein FX983_02266 [Pseudomonas frederiksbergensis]|uniref:Uncharacterized protein n=1 Tax=Pseudomonas frederiksbergensis TaxID=104087 RepID=A0A6L5C278_9PSED|nr:hypothetical protein FX983_02266 [Pseudomonas frederiksbergensis]